MIIQTVQLEMKARVNQSTNVLQQLRKRIPIRPERDLGQYTFSF